LEEESNDEYQPNGVAQQAGDQQEKPAEEEQPERLNQTTGRPAHEQLQQAGRIEDRPTGHPKKEDPQPSGEEDLEEDRTAADGLCELDQQGDLGTEKREEKEWHVDLRAMVAD